MESVPSGLTTGYSAKYTLRYASPELYETLDAVLTLQSDVWAWGCLALTVRSNISHIMGS